MTVDEDEQATSTAPLDEERPPPAKNARKAAKKSGYCGGGSDSDYEKIQDDNNM